jgi:hypothetical protein
VSVVVNINPGPPVMSSQGYQIKNQSANGVYLAFIQKEKGYEDSVESRPVGTILKPGETFRAELTRWFFYNYDTSFTFYGCSDETCGPSSPTTDKEWTVAIRTYSSGTFAECRGSGFCSNYLGTDISESRGSIVVNLLDTRAPK